MGAVFLHHFFNILNICMNENTNTALSYTDVQLMVQIIQQCTVRGAFRAEELEAVGTLYTKLSNAMKFATEQVTDSKELGS